MAAWAVGLTLASLVRYNMELDATSRRGLLLAIGVTTLLQVVVGYVLSLYRRRHYYGSFEEVAALAAVVFVVGAILTGFVLTRSTHPVPLSVAVAGGIPTLVAMCSVRYAWRLLVERRRRFPDHRRATTGRPSRTTATSARRSS